MIEPREPREFSDMSDYPQNGWGLMDVDRDYPEEETDDQEEACEPNDDQE